MVLRPWADVGDGGRGGSGIEDDDAGDFMRGR
jgi:hypothetical protein